MDSCYFLFWNISERLSVLIFGNSLETYCLLLKCYKVMLINQTAVQNKENFRNKFYSKIG